MSTVDRNRLEQDAMRLLQRGQTDKALACYQQLLRQDPRDRRIRQRVAELTLQLGRHAEAERYFRDIAEQLVSSGQERAAISVLKQILKLRSDDAELIATLGNCYRVSGFPVDARKCYERVVQMLGRSNPGRASEVQLELIRLAPGELPLKVQFAELLEAANWSERAHDAWLDLAKEALRLGRGDERARFLEQCLRIRVMPSTMLDAAEARLAMGDAAAALKHLHGAYESGERGARTLTLLARAFTALGQPEKARPVWLQAARLLEEAGEVEELARALRAALETGADDPALVARLAAVDAEAERTRMRLHLRPWADPPDLPIGRVVVRASVLGRYGLRDRARAVLREADPEIRRTLAVRVLLAELLVEDGEIAAAAAELRRVQPKDAEVAADIHSRLTVLLGRAAEHSTDVADGLEDLDDEVIDDELIDDEDLQEEEEEPAEQEDVEDDPTVDDEPAVGHAEAEGDALASAGQVGAAIEAYRRALREDPTNERALMRIGELMALDRTPVSPTPAPSLPSFVEEEPEEDDPFAAGFGTDEDARFEALLQRGGTFAEVDPDSFLSPSDDDLDEDLPPWEDLDADALGRGLARLGMSEILEGWLEGRVDLGAQVLRAQALAASGQAARALGLLQAATAGVGESDPSYAEALLELVALHARTGKLRAAARLLDEHDEADPGHRAEEALALRLALEHLQER